MDSKKGEKILFYEKCKAEGYTDMSDDTQSLKAKVIAMDLGLNYKKIDALYNEAKSLYEEREQYNKHFFTDGKLILTLLSSGKNHNKENRVDIFRRDDGTLYHKTNNSWRTDDNPKITVKDSATYHYTYHPSKTIFTGASSGGIAMGGFHETQAYMTENINKSSKGYMVVEGGGNISFEVLRIVIPEHICEQYKNSKYYKTYVHNGTIQLFDSTNSINPSMAPQMLANAYTATTLMSLSSDSVRLPMPKICEIFSLVSDILDGNTPPTDDMIFNQAVNLCNSACSSSEFKQAIELFQKIPRYKNANDLCANAMNKYASAQQREKEEYILKKEDVQKKRKIALKITSVIIALAVIIGTVGHRVYTVNKAEEIFANAEGAYNAGEYDKALEMLKTEDITLIDENKVTYLKALCQFGKKNYPTARNLFKSIIDYGDSAEQLKEIEYTIAKNSYDSGRYEDAISKLKTISDYKDSASLIDSANEILETQRKEAEEQAARDAEQQRRVDLFNQIQMEVFLANYEEAEKLIEELPQDFIDENKEVQGFLEKLPDADRTITGYWHTYSGGYKKDTRREDFGHLFGLVYVNGKFVYGMEYFLDGENTFPDFIRAKGIDNIKILADWSFDGKTLKYNDSNDILYGKTVFVYESRSDSLKKIETVIHKSYLENFTTERTTVYVR